MFEKDIKRIKACMEYKDYYSALQYASIMKENYKDKERVYLEEIIKDIKEGDYNKIRNRLG